LNGVAESIEVYFTDAEGNRWRVYDVVFGPPLAEPGRRAVLAHGDPRARFRLFVPREGHLLRLHRFGGVAGDEDRSLDVTTLAEQLRGATYSPKQRVAPPRDPPGTKLGQ
jgi:hypothetical protein